MLLLYVCLLAVGHVSFGKTLLAFTTLLGSYISSVQSVGVIVSKSVVAVHYDDKFQREQNTSVVTDWLDRPVSQDAPTFGICHRSDSELNNCLLRQAGFALKMLKNGIPEYGLEPIDPFKTDFMTAESDLELIKIKMVMKNISLIGHTDALTIKSVKYDPISQSGEISFNIPSTRMICEYLAKGQLFVLPLESSAHFDGNFTGMDMTLSFRLNTIEKKGKEYFTVEKMAMKMRVENAHIKLISTDPARQQQVNLIQDFFNENDRLVLDTVNPIAIHYGAKYFKIEVENYLRRIPADVLLPK